jgi:formylglycine-generating enzyme required for sulfatase activity
VELLGRLGLALPSEAQWEYGCRGGTTSVYWCGDAKESLQGVANLSDAYGKSHGNEVWGEWEPWLDDGQTAHAEVGSYRANAFGLHDVHGNVWEWCLDGHADYSRSAAKDPVGPSEGARLRVIRGGGYFNGAAIARSAFRLASSPAFRVVLGLRVARASRLAPLPLRH